MIISHKHKFIFIKTVKTAGTSIEIALSSICGPDDIITPISSKDEKLRTELGIRGPQNTLVPFSRYNLQDWLFLLVKLRRVRYYNHVPGTKIKQWIDAKSWEDYYIFCFERNPFDKVVSHYFWKGGDRKFKSISRYLTSSKRKKIESWRQYRIRGQQVVDDIYPFENITDSLIKISDKLRLGAPLEMPNVKTKSSSRKDKRHWSEILSSSEQEKIREIFSETFEVMNYPKS